MKSYVRFYFTCPAIAFLCHLERYVGRINNEQEAIQQNYERPYEAC